MKLYSQQFLDLDETYSSFEKAAVILLPVPYEKGASYGLGTAEAPDAVLNASCHLELYDEVLEIEPCNIGIATVCPPTLPDDPEGMIQAVYQTSLELIQQQKFVILVGGDHSVSFGYFKAIQEYYNQVSVIQLDAHTDLRQTFNGSKWSHACVMSRIRELTSHTLQIGIRSISVEEAELAKKDKLALCMMHQYKKGDFDLDKALSQLPDPVYLTIDVDAFDWSVISSTGTPEPGGFTWDEGISLLQKIFSRKNVIGFDVVELSHRKGDLNSPFAVAKMIYKLIGFKFLETVQNAPRAV